MIETGMARIARSMIGGLRAILRTFFLDVMRSTSLLTATFFVRVFYFCKVRGNLKSIEADSAFPVTIKHNMRMLWKKLNRMNLLIRPLSVLEQVDRSARILVIGPRNEWDLFLLHQCGFSFKNCIGLDLISYSPRILLGDMHEMPFLDNEFDIVLCGWTISYSAEPAKACREMSRVCKKTGTIGVSVEYFVGDEDAERKATGGYLIKDSRLERRVNSTDQILELFPGHGVVYFNHDAPLKRSVPPETIPSNCAVIFRNS